MMTIANNIIAYLKFAERVDLKSPHHMKNFLCSFVMNVNYIYHGAHFVIYSNTKSLCHIPEVSMLHANYTSVTKE